MSDDENICVFPQCDRTGRHGHLRTDVNRWSAEMNPDDPAHFNYAPLFGNPDELSTNDYCALLPKRRWAHEAKGKILFFPRTKITGVPVEMKRGGGYNVVVVHSDHPSYPVGGYNLFVSETEIVTALEFYWYDDPAKAQLVPISYREPDPNSPFRRMKQS